VCTLSSQMKPNNCRSLEQKRLALLSQSLERTSLDWLASIISWLISWTLSERNSKSKKLTLISSDIDLNASSSLKNWRARSDLSSVLPSKSSWRSTKLAKLTSLSHFRLSRSSSKRELRRTRNSMRKSWSLLEAVLVIPSLIKQSVKMKSLSHYRTGKRLKCHSSRKLLVWW